MCPPIEATSDALLQVLATLRRAGDEAQWTQLIAASAAHDDAFAATLAEALIDAAPRADRVAAIKPVPARLNCRAERVVHDASDVGQGRVDLIFTGHDFALICELKLHSGYGDRQLERYLTALDALPERRKALIAATTLHPQHGEEAVAGRPEWLGSIRWADVYDRLAALTHADRGVANTWRAMLALMRRTGDFGPMDLHDDLILGWARRDDAEAALRGLLTNLTTPALEAIRSTAGSAELRWKGKTQHIFSMKNRMFLHYAVPASANEARLRLQVIVFDGRPYFTVEARYEHPAEHVANDATLAEATAALQNQGFRHGRDGTGWFWVRIAKPQDWLAGPETAQRMLAIVEETLPVLQASGIFTALATRRPTTTETSPAEEPTAG
jgi:hypothetical protein